MRRSKKNKRVPKEATRIDFKDAQTPIDITKIGTEDDPCFGKLYEPVTEECHSCGDSELCAIVHMHTLDKTRKKIEKKQKFKDIDEAVEKQPFMSTTKLTKIIEKFVKASGKVKFKDIVKRVQSKYDPNSLLPPGRVLELTKIAIKSSSVLKKKKINGKVYIRYMG